MLDPESMPSATPVQPSGGAPASIASNRSSSPHNGGGGAADTDDDGAGAAGADDAGAGASASRRKARRWHAEQQSLAHFERLYKNIQPYCDLTPDVVSTAIEILETQAAAATTIQAWWRNHSDMSKQLQLRTQAATTLQAMWRGQLVRRRYNRTLDVLRVLNKRQYLSKALVQAVEQGNVTRLQLLLGQWPETCTAATDALVEGGWCVRTGAYLGSEVTSKIEGAAATFNATAGRQPEFSRSRYANTAANDEAAPWKPAERSYRFYAKKSLQACRVHHTPSKHGFTLYAINSAASKRHLIIQREYGSRIITNEHGTWIQLANPDSMFGDGPAWVLVSDARTPLQGVGGPVSATTEFFEEKRSTDYLAMSVDCVGRLDAEVINYDRSIVTAGPGFRNRLDEPTPFRKGTGLDGVDAEDARRKTLLPAIDLPKVLVVNQPLEPMLLVKAASSASAALLDSATAAAAGTVGADYLMVAIDADAVHERERNDDGSADANEPTSTMDANTATAATPAAVSVLDALLASPCVDATAPIDPVDGTTILHVCAEKNLAAVIKYLLEDPGQHAKLLHLVDNNQCTALLSAVLSNATAAAEVLLAAGADPRFAQLPPGQGEDGALSDADSTAKTGMAFEVLCNEGPTETQVCRPARVKSVYNATSGGWECEYDDKKYNRSRFRITSIAKQVRPLGWGALQNPPIPTLLPTCIPVPLVTSDTRGTIDWEVYNAAFVATVDQGYGNNTSRYGTRKQQRQNALSGALPAKIALNLAGLLDSSAPTNAGGSKMVSVGSSSTAADPASLSAGASTADAVAGMWGLHAENAEHFRAFRVLNGRGFTAATAAASVRSVELIAMLARAGVNFDHQDSTGDTPLLRALELDTGTSATPDPVAAAAAAVEQLLALGCLTDVPNHSGETPLMRAARWSDATLLKLLLNAGADPTLWMETDAYDETGVLTTALKVASECGNFEHVRILLTAITDAEKGGCYSYLHYKAAADSGNDEHDYLSYINEGTCKMENELLAAVKAGHVQVANMLIEAGATPGNSAVEITRVLCSLESLELASKADAATAGDLVEASTLGSAVADMAVTRADDAMKHAAKFGSNALAPASIVTARAHAIKQITQSVKAAKEGRRFVSAIGLKDAARTQSMLTPPPTPPTTDESGGSSADEASEASNHGGESENDDDIVVIHRHPDTCTCSSSHGTVIEPGDGGQEKEKVAGGDGDASPTVTSLPLPAVAAIRNVVAAAHTSIVLGAALANAALFKDYTAMKTVAELLESLIPEEIAVSAAGLDSRAVPASTSTTVVDDGAVAPDWSSLFTDNIIERIAFAHAVTMMWTVDPLSDLVQKLLKHTPERVPDYWRQSVADYITKDLFAASPTSVADSKNVVKIKWSISMVSALMDAKWSPQAAKAAQLANEADVSTANDTTSDAAVTAVTTQPPASPGTVPIGSTAVDLGDVALGDGPDVITLEEDLDALEEDHDVITSHPEYLSIGKASGSERIGGGHAANLPRAQLEASSAPPPNTQSAHAREDAANQEAAKDLKSWALPVIEKCVLYQTGFDTSVAATSTDMLRTVAITFLSTHCPERCARCGICDEDFLESKPLRVSDQNRGTEHFKKEKCTHAYCEDCLKQWIQTNLNQNLALVRCPCADCTVTMYEDDIGRIAGPDAKVKFAKLRQANHRERLIELIKNKKLHTEVSKDSKPCPRCHVVINRYTGCDSMMCNCGHSFNWRSTQWPTVSELKAMA